MSEKFGKYELERKIAQGGMADIFLAVRDPETGGSGERLVVKRIFRHLTDREETVRMFVDEARIASALSHPNIVEIYDHGEVDGYFFTSMEFVEGTDVRQVCRRGLKEDDYLPARIAAHIVAASAGALHAAHESEDAEGRPRNIVHRDVSPQNVLVSRDGEVKLCDFGIATAENRLAQSQPGQFKGKLSHLSPEQVDREGVDARSDVFNLGILLYEITLARRLFDADSDVERMEQVAEARVEPPTAIHPDYPERLEAIVMEALERDPADRYQTAGAMQRELEDWLRDNGGAVDRRRVGAYVRELFPEFERDIGAALSELNDISTPTDIENERHGSTAEEQTERPPVGDARSIDDPGGGEGGETAPSDETRARGQAPSTVGSVSINPGASPDAETAGEWDDLPDTDAGDASASGPGGEGDGESQQSDAGEATGGRSRDSPIGGAREGPAAGPGSRAPRAAGGDADQRSEDDPGRAGRDRPGVDEETSVEESRPPGSTPPGSGEPGGPAPPPHEPATETAAGAPAHGAESTESGGGPAADDQTTQSEPSAFDDGFAARERRRRVKTAAGAFVAVAAVVGAAYYAVVAGVDIPGLTDRSAGRTAQRDAGAETVGARISRIDVRLETDPPGAHVVVNGHLAAGTTPGDFRLVEGQRNEVYLYKQGLMPGHRIIRGDPNAEPDPVELSPPSGDAVRTKVEFESEPSGAEVRFDGRSIGETPVTVAQVPVDADHHVQLKEEGHFRHNGLFRPVAGDRYPYAADLPPRKGGAEFCRVVYDFVPNSAVVQVDGEIVGTARLATHHDCGTHLNVRAWRANYHDRRHVLSTKSPGVFRLGTHLEEIDRVEGRVEVEVPEDVRVYIGSNEIGVGSVESLALPSGLHRAVFETPDRERYRHDLEIVAGTTVRYRFVLRDGEGRLERIRE